MTLLVTWIPLAEKDGVVRSRKSVLVLNWCEELLGAVFSGDDADTIKLPEDVSTRFQYLIGTLSRPERRDAFAVLRGEFPQIRNIWFTSEIRDERRKS